MPTDEDALITLSKTIHDIEVRVIQDKQKISEAVKKRGFPIMSSEGSSKAWDDTYNNLAGHKGEAKEVEPRDGTVKVSFENDDTAGTALKYVGDTPWIPVEALERQKVPISSRTLQDLKKRKPRPEHDNLPGSLWAELNDAIEGTTRGLPKALTKIHDLGRCVRCIYDKVYFEFGKGADGDKNELDAFKSMRGYSTHSKLMVVDEKAFYLGSQNFYPAGLSEYGIGFQ